MEINKMSCFIQLQCIITLSQDVKEVNGQLFVGRYFKKILIFLLSPCNIPIVSLESKSTTQHLMLISMYISKYPCILFLSTVNSFLIVSSIGWPLFQYGAFTPITGDSTVQTFAVRFNSQMLLGYSSKPSIWLYKALKIGTHANCPAAACPS